ncbi:MAG: PilZ domain-containing protein [Acidobacteriota bacterium]
MSHRDFADDRRHPRVRLTHAVRLTFSNSPEETETHTANLSESGMFVANSSPPPIGTMVRFRIDFGAGGGNSHPEEIVQGYGHVVWVRFSSSRLDEPAGLGIEFGALNARSRSLLRARIYQALKEMSVETSSTFAAGG